jgi:RNA recognition motif-containing protein
MKIFIASLPFNIMEEDLFEAFSNFGVIATVKIIGDKISGKSKGFGFIEMPDNDCALRAILALNGAEVNGRNIVVSPATDTAA